MPPEWVSDGTARGEQIFRLPGKGNSPITLPKLGASVKEVTFQVQCDTGKFAMRSKGKPLFGGDCSPKGKYTAKIPLQTDGPAGAHLGNRTDCLVENSRLGGV